MCQWQQEGPRRGPSLCRPLQAAGRCWRATMNDNRKEERKSSQSGIVGLKGLWHKGAQTETRTQTKWNRQCIHKRNYSHICVCVCVFYSDFCSKSTWHYVFIMYSMKLFMRFGTTVNQHTELVLVVLLAPPASICPLQFEISKIFNCD